MAMPAKKVTKNAAANKSAAPKTAVEMEAVKKTTNEKPAAKKAAKKPAAKQSLTTIVVTYDAGIGNNLALRGDAPGLSWDSGTIMENIDSETWQWTTSDAKSAFEVKFLINDITWSQGENFAVKPGTTAGFSPNF